MCKRKGWEEVNEVSVFGGCDGKREKKRKEKESVSPIATSTGGVPQPRAKAAELPAEGLGRRWAAAPCGSWQRGWAWRCSGGSCLGFVRLDSRDRERTQRRAESLVLLLLTPPIPSPPNTAPSHLGSHSSQQQRGLLQDTLHRARFSPIGLAPELLLGEKQFI